MFQKLNQLKEKSSRENEAKTIEIENDFLKNLKITSPVFVIRMKGYI